MFVMKYLNCSCGTGGGDVVIGSIDIEIGSPSVEVEAQAAFVSIDASDQEVEIVANSSTVIIEDGD